MNDLNSSQNPAARPCFRGFFGLLGMVGLLALVTPLRADNPPAYLFEWGSLGSGNGQFNDPSGITVDSSNNVYVVDAGNNRIEKFDSNGNYLTRWGSHGSGNGQFNSPSGIAVDSGNNVYVVDADNNRIEKFDSNGNYLTQWASGVALAGIALDGNTNVYVIVADAYPAGVEKFSSDGNFLTQWGTIGAGNGQFEQPTGIAVDSGNNVYVVDQETAHVEKSTSRGNYLTQWGSFGGGNGQFNNPSGIAVDSSTKVYVVDPDNSRIEKFTSNGTYLTQWGSPGSGAGQFSNPFGIAVDSTGNFIYVVDQGNSRVEVFVNNPNIVAPIITKQPASQVFSAGANLTLSVGAVGTPPLAYQWTSNQVALPGATNATFLLTNVNASDSGNYSVLVTNSVGSELSSIAVLFLPAVVMTHPASGVTNTGAVLNGSVTIGSDETVVWFEWGADTNYGNIAGETIIPGNNGSNNISSTLSGLSGNIYHYRIDATNDFGMVYGNDVSFTVGFAPTVTALEPMNSTNGVALNGTVNPQGWDTMVYFKWGAFPGSLTNLTPVVDAGAGAVPVNASSFITGLVPFKQYSVEVVASNHLGNVTSTAATFYSPPFVTVPGEDWTSVAASADGSVMIAVANPGGPKTGPVYISTNSGAVWNQVAHAPLGCWESVACSADGSKIVAVQGGAGGGLVGSIYTSSDMGVTWVSNNAPVQGWQSVASSADGTKLAVADLSAPKIFTSTNGGSTWAQASNAPAQAWYSIASSADGSKLAAVANAGQAVPSPGATNIYTSTNFGATWITNRVPAGPSGHQNDWTAIASSADGRILVAAGGGSSPGYIFVSTNFGATWTVTATNLFPTHGFSGWIYVAVSADGSKMAAVSESGVPGGLISSTDSGVTWTTNAVPNLNWNAVALSADGARMVVTVGYPSYVGPIYTTQTTRAPVLKLSVADNVISWMVPSLNFTLQQSSDLLNWLDLTNPAVLNLTNLQQQVALPPPGANTFYRLLH